MKELTSINLKGFDGEPENCKRFLECSVHDNIDLSDIKKIAYLKNLVEGHASDIIAGWKLSCKNYVILEIY